MADITRNSFNSTNGYKGVIIQAERPLTDADLNEAQDILANESASTLRAMLGAPDGSTTTGTVPAFVMDPDDCVAKLNTSGGITISTGDLIVNGYRLTIASEIQTQALPVPVTITTSPSAQFGWIYAEIQLTEVTSGDDPSIAFPFLGETAVRKKLTVTFKKATSSASWEAAWNGIAAVTPGNVQLGYKARFVVGRFYVPAAGDPLDPTHNEVGMATFHSLIQCTRDMAPFVTSGEGVAWTGRYLYAGAAYDYVYIGSGATISTHIRAVAAGSESTFEHFARAINESVIGDYANADSPSFPVTPTAEQAWDIPQGYALGWLAESSSTNRTSQRHNNVVLPVELGGSPAWVRFLDNGRTPGAYEAFYAMRLVVAKLKDFSRCPGSRVLAFNSYGNLVFESGSVVPGPISGGDTSKTRPGTIGFTPSTVDVVVAEAQGSPAHMVGKRSLERAMQAFWKGNIPAGDYDGAGSFKAELLAGDYSFPNNSKTYGSYFGEAYGPNTPLLHLRGRGPGTTVRVNPPAGVIGVTFLSDTIILEGITFDVTGTPSASTTYAFRFRGRKVVIRDCTFRTPVKIEAEKITIENCEVKLRNEAGWRAEHAANTLGASGIHLAGMSTSVAHRWTLRGVNVRHADASITDNLPAILIDTNSVPESTTVLLDHCSFSYENATLAAASVSIAGRLGRIKIRECSFDKHPGFVKGTAAAWQSSPMAAGNRFVGSPVMSPTSVDYVNITTTAYVSCVSDRSYRSSISVEECWFDMSCNGDLLAAGSSASMLGAFMAMHNGFTVRGKNYFTVCNLSFVGNKLSMARKFGGTYDYTNKSIMTWGFYVGAISDGLPISSNYSTTYPTTITYAQQSVYANIRCHGNSFDLGVRETGTSSSPTAQIWRSILSRDESTAGPRDISCLFGVSLKNRVSGSDYNGKRGATGVSFTENTVGFRTSHEDVGASYFHRYAELDSTGATQFCVVLETDSYYGLNKYPATEATVTSVDYGRGPSYRSPLQAIVSPLIALNHFDLADANADDTTTPGSECVLLSKTSFARIIGNHVNGNSGGMSGLNRTNYGLAGLLVGNTVVGATNYANSAVGKNSSAANMLWYNDVTSFRQTFTDGTDYDET